MWGPPGCPPQSLQPSGTWSCFHGLFHFQQPQKLTKRRLVTFLVAVAQRRGCTIDPAVCSSQGPSSASSRRLHLPALLRLSARRAPCQIQTRSARKVPGTERGSMRRRHCRHQPPPAQPRPPDAHSPGALSATVRARQGQAHHIGT
ncbi:uncharacterized protein LOC119517420 isoform X7 [Choloepus didactylus]|uniref:uncharacterized protein LOC119517420 isoform X7 n=1 Tax=Choloepus didactylus TaxID=27675 RepID=UPI00189E747F|nr:uncharacterized protein LOC119517420 isoform X7 [Choloepus didactylus]